MGAFLQEQLDFIFFGYGLAFFLVAMVCATFIKRGGKSNLDYTWLLLFALLHGANEWLDMIALSVPALPVFRIGRLALLGLSFVPLLEFGRSSLTRGGARGLTVLIYIPLAILVFAGILLMPAAGDAVCRYLLCLPGGLLAGFAFWRQSRLAAAPDRQLLTIAAAAILVYAVTAGTIATPGPIPPITFMNYGTFFMTFGFPVQLARALCAGGLAVALWNYNRLEFFREIATHPQPLLIHKQLMLLLGAILLAGWLTANRFGIARADQLRADLSNELRLAALTINPQQVAGLNRPFPALLPKDPARLTPLLRRLARALPRYRSFYLLGLKNNRAIMLADSEPFYSRDYFPSGRFYPHQPAAVKKVFALAAGAVTGIFQDSRGAWISVLAPISDPATGAVLAVLGADLPAAFWQHQIGLYRLLIIIAVILLMLAALNFYLYRARSAMYVFQKEAVRQQAEEALRRAKEDWETTFDSVPDMICILDANYTITRINRAMAEYLGLNTEEALGRYCYICGHHTGAPPPFCPFEKLMRDGQTHFSEYQDARHGAWLQISIAPRRDKAGRIIGAVHLARNITERKKAEEERRKLLAELRRSNADLKEFSTVASHDLQEPLRIVAGFAELLQKRHPQALNAEANEYLDLIIDGVRRMQNLITDFLRLARASIRDRHPVIIEANRALDDALKNIGKTITENGARICADQLPALWFERAELCQVFQNLIGNAIKFRREHPLTIHISARELEQEWEFCVRDNGAGFEQKNAARIFEPFQRLADHQGVPGSGIGLAICKKIIEHNGGAIWAESEPGQGTCFKFTVPKTPRAMALAGLADRAETHGC